MASEFEKYWPYLRAWGFKKVWASRHQDGASRQYERREGHRTIEIRIEENGRHYVTHRTYHKNDDRRWKQATRPTLFNNPKELDKAIQYELERPDPFDEYLNYI